MSLKESLTPLTPTSPAVQEHKIRFAVALRHLDNQNTFKVDECTMLELFRKKNSVMNIILLRPRKFQIHAQISEHNSERSQNEIL
jgi:hypothetical protein